MPQTPKSRSAPRLQPIPVEQWDEVAIAAVREAFPASLVEDFRAEGTAPNVLATMLHHPALASAFNRFGNVLLTKPLLGHRARELMLLRVAWRTGAQYEWVHHVRLAKGYGVDDRDVAALAEGDSESWSPLERELVAATDQLLDHYRISDETWSRLRDRLDDGQLVELPFIVGAYTCLAMAFNSWELRVEDGVDTTGVPSLPDRPTWPCE